MTKKEDNKQYPLPLVPNGELSPEAKISISDRAPNHLVAKKVITTTAFIEKRNEIKNEIFSSIISRAKHLYD